MTSFVRSVILFVGGCIGFAAAVAVSAWSDPNRGTQSASSAELFRAGEERRYGSENVDPEDALSFERLLGKLEGARVVYVGETHDRYDHHLNQLAIIRGLHERGVDLAVGMEFFQEPFQVYLDRYVAGEIGEKALLKKSEYYKRWGYDYRLYRDILTYARASGIPLVALNAPSELVERVSEDGIARSLPGTARRALRVRAFTLARGLHGL